MVPPAVTDMALQRHFLDVGDEAWSVVALHLQRLAERQRPLEAHQLARRGCRRSAGRPGAAGPAPRARRPARGCWPGRSARARRRRKIWSSVSLRLHLHADLRQACLAASSAASTPDSALVGQLRRRPSQCWAMSLRCAEARRRRGCPGPATAAAAQQLQSAQRHHAAAGSGDGRWVRVPLKRYQISLLHNNSSETILNDARRVNRTARRKCPNLRLAARRAGRPSAILRIAT